MQMKLLPPNWYTNGQEVYENRYFLIIIQGNIDKRTMTLLNIHQIGNILSLTRSSAGEDMKQLEFSPIYNCFKKQFSSILGVKEHLYLHKC